MNSELSDLKKPSFLEGLEIYLRIIPDNEIYIFRNYSFKSNRKGEIILAEIIYEIKDNGYSIENSFISFYSGFHGIYLSCGFDPLPSYYLVRNNMLINGYQLFIDARIQSKSNKNNHDLFFLAKQKDNTIPIRSKERNISTIIEAVYNWRYFHSEFFDSIDSNDYMTLDKAASLVKFSKKTLDDYFGQLRRGKELGFDFNKHRNDKVGVLRGFIKKLETKRSKPESSISFPDNIPRKIFKIEPTKKSIQEFEKPFYGIEEK